jgi:hypothetical protein
LWGITRPPNRLESTLNPLNVSSTASPRAMFLFNLPGLRDGLAEVFNLPGFNHVRYAESKSPNQADGRALRQDWLSLADDLDDAAGRVRIA